MARAREEVRRLQILGTESWFWILAGSGCRIPTAPATAKTTNFKASWSYKGEYILLVCLDLDLVISVVRNIYTYYEKKFIVP